MSKPHPESILRKALIAAHDELIRANQQAACIRPDVIYIVGKALLDVPALPGIPNASDIEKRIAGKVISCLLDAGYTISVNDGEETVLKNSTDPERIYAVMGSTGEDILYVLKSGCARSFVLMIWGNEVDLISDHGTSLTEVLEPALDLADALDDRGQS